MTEPIEKDKILIVDDDEGIRESLDLILSDFYNTIKTDDGAQALEILKNCASISLVMLDLKLPKVDGFEILNQIKELYPDLKTILVTGYKSGDTIAKANELGADGYITKPFIPEEVLEIVKKNI